MKKFFYLSLYILITSLSICVASDSDSDTPKDGNNIGAGVHAAAEHATSSSPTSPITAPASSTLPTAPAPTDNHAVEDSLQADSKAAITAAAITQEGKQMLLRTGAWLLRTREGQCVLSLFAGYTLGWANASVTHISSSTLNYCPQN